MKFLLSFMALIFLGHLVQGQEECELIERASVSYCQEDFNETELALREIMTAFPEHNLTEELSYSLGEVMFRLERYEESRVFLTSLFGQMPDTTAKEYELIDCPTHYDDLFPEEKFGCLRLVFPEENQNIKHDILLLLSKIAVIQEDPKASIEFLQKAKSPYFKNYHCGNGNNMVRSYLAIDLAASYLLLGDTLSALKQLFPEVNNVDGNFRKVREMSQDLASRLYSEVEINRIITEASQTLNKEIVVRFEREYTFYFYEIFNEKVQFFADIYSHERSLSLSENKKILEGFLTLAFVGK